MKNCLQHVVVVMSSHVLWSPQGSGLFSVCIGSKLTCINAFSSPTQSARMNLMSVREDGNGIDLPLGVAVSVGFTLGAPDFHLFSVEEILAGEKRPEDFHSFLQPD